MFIFFLLLLRLLEELVQKEREFQVLLHQAIEEKDQEIKNLRLRSQPIGEKQFQRKISHWLQMKTDRLVFIEPASANTFYYVAFDTVCFGAHVEEINQ